MDTSIRVKKKTFYPTVEKFSKRSNI